MKRLLLTTFVFLFSLGRLSAGPVDVKTAQSIGEKFVRANMETLRNFQTSKHIGTWTDEKGTASLYIFNIDDKGFYIVSADDRAKPILAFSDEGALDFNNIPSNMAYYLDRYTTAISFVVENNLEADAEVAEEWNLVKSRGIVTEKTLGRSVEPLINLLWNQDSPYNMYCPAAPGGPGGRAYVGCAADAMAMVMKFWNYPDAGVGEHSYIPPGFPQQSVTFGEAYDWDNMPIQLYNSSSQTQKHAVAILMYHCGVSIDMGYGADGSGAFSSDVPEAMYSHFKYTDKMKLEYRDSFTKKEWEDMLIANFDQGFPAFYAGHSVASGGHAFVCDGYTDNRYFHFNWGWTGSGNGNFAIDALNPSVWGQSMQFNDGQNAIFDMIPDYAYELMPDEPEMEVRANSVYSKKGTITVEVPETSESGAELTSIEKVVIMRDGVEIYSESNVTPGSVVTYEDEVSQYGCYIYRAYAICDGIKGRFEDEALIYGPTCECKLISTTTSFQGWNGATLQFLASNGVVFEEVTTDDSTPISKEIQIPEGEFSLKWNAPMAPMSSIVIKLKDSSNETIYEYSGPSTGLTAGIIFNGENSCENCQAPEDLTAEEKFMNGQGGTLVSWEKKGEPEEFIIYRSEDGDDYDKIAKIAATENQYFDAVEAGTYYYQVTAENGNCESMPAATADGEADYVMVEVTSIAENNIGAAVYPNPAREYLNIEAEGLMNVTLYNMVGQKVFEQNVDADEFVLDMTSMENGVYMLKVVSRNGEMTQRISVID